ncbi:MAG TPA: MFS transporter, partial [Methylomirabilota bacterium]|nr:MFS transporter [Methylomirabilota bacterium]
ILLSLLPLMTALASPLSGRWSDRIPPGGVATIGLVLILFGVLFYSRLGFQSTYIAVAIALGVIGMGIGVFTPANQKVAFASVGNEDYGVLSALLSSFATAAGTLGTTAAVALLELKMVGFEANDPLAFASAQRFAFAWLLPLGVLAVFVAFRAQWKAKPALTSTRG